MTTLAELRQANLKEQQPTPPASQKEDSVTSPAPPLSGAGGPSSAVEDVAVLHMEAVLPPTELEVRGGEMLAQIHAATAKKTQYSSGAKVSIDMPTALFHRAKRYCSTHGNVSLRQMCLELLTAYLDEEGA